MRELQDETGGFTGLIPLAFHPENTPLAHLPETSGQTDLRVIAASRLLLDNFPHIKAYWIQIGTKLSQIALFFGADDLVGTVVDETITHAAGAKTASGMTRKEFERVIRESGREPFERDARYRRVMRAGRGRTVSVRREPGPVLPAEIAPRPTAAQCWIGVLRPPPGDRLLRPSVPLETPHRRRRRRSHRAHGAGRGVPGVRTEHRRSRYSEPPDEDDRVLGLAVGAGRPGLSDRPSRPIRSGQRRGRRPARRRRALRADQVTAVGPAGRGPRPLRGTGAIWRDTLVSRPRDRHLLVRRDGRALPGPLAGRRLGGIPAVVTRADRVEVRVPRLALPRPRRGDLRAAHDEDLPPLSLAGRFRREAPDTRHSRKTTSSHQAGDEALAFTAAEIEGAGRWK